MNRNTLIYILGTAAVTLILILAITSAWVGFTTADTCERSKKLYDTDDCVTALINQLENENQSYGERNDAIWALGQYGDAKALPTLQKYYTGEIPSREPWNETLSQYELQKAINLLEGGFNITVIFRALSLGRV